MNYTVDDLGGLSPEDDTPAVRAAVQAAIDAVAEPTEQEMVQQALEHPVLSAHHQWEPGQQADYDRLPAKGRRLYDNLRTQFPDQWNHDEAWDRAVEEFGVKEEEPCCYPWYQTRQQQHAVDCPRYP